MMYTPECWDYPRHFCGQPSRYLSTTRQGCQPECWDYPRHYCGQPSGYLKFHSFPLYILFFNFLLSFLDCLALSNSQGFLQYLSISSALLSRSRIIVCTSVLHTSIVFKYMFANPRETTIYPFILFTQ